MDIKKKKILIIEDEYPVRISIREILEGANYEVFAASDGLDGIQLAKEIKPNLIICDIMMPGLTGFEVIEKLKKEEIFNSIPFIFLSAKAELSDLRNGMELGADDYITKPFRAQNLLKTVETRLQKFEAIQQRKVEPADEEPEGKQSTLTENDRLFINVKNKPQIVKVCDIICIKAQGEYSTVCLISGTKLLTRKLIKQWEKQLPENVFLRIHRSTIINLNQIEKIEKWYNRSYVVHLKNIDENFVISQRYASKIKTNFIS